MTLFYVYEFWRADTNQPFYVGKGSAKRMTNFNSRGRYCRSVIKSLRRRGISINTKRVFRTTNEEKAFAYEIKRIAYWRDLGAALTTRGPRGDGAAGYRWTDNQKKRASEAAKKRWRDPIYRRKTREAHSLALANPNTNKAVWSKKQYALHKENMRVMWSGEIGDKIRRERIRLGRTLEFRSKMRKAMLASWALRKARSNIENGVSSYAP